MIKALMVALALMVPTLAQANSKQAEFCESFSGLAYSVAEARDLGTPVLEVVGVLLSVGLEFKLASLISTSVYSDLKDVTPEGVKSKYYSVCMGQVT